MISKRIIPCLDVKNGRVVKGVNFEGIQDVADPVEMAEFYNQSGADELVFYDITASVEAVSYTHLDVYKRQESVFIIDSLRCVTRSRANSSSTEKGLVR